MAKTTNITKYACDRCGAEAYLPKGDPRESDWREVSRVTADGVSVSRLLCAQCTTGYKALASEQDAAFTAFMAGGDQ